MKVKDRCSSCKGKGQVADYDGFDQTCLDCGGTGKKVEKRYCPECDGIMVKSQAGGWCCYHGCQK